ncbi:unnamed protein product [Dicrocoelium dendriticum]|nr:unnamed protein product [Dicrocoelium dendriticum]
MDDNDAPVARTFSEQKRARLTTDKTIRKAISDSRRRRKEARKVKHAERISKKALDSDLCNKELTTVDEVVLKDHVEVKTSGGASSSPSQLPLDEFTLSNRFDAADYIPLVTQSDSISSGGNQNNHSKIIKFEESEYPGQ